jgi:lactam utilization protein B
MTLGFDTGLMLGVDTICVHSDTAGAVAIAQAVRNQTRA